MPINNPIQIKNCIIQEFEIYGTWFIGGLIFENNVVISTIDYQAGGHNKLAIVIKNNIFKQFLNCVDCHFEDKVFIENNNFISGSNLLGNLTEGFANIFKSGYIASQNLGNIAVND